MLDTPDGIGQSRGDWISSPYVAHGERWPSLTFRLLYAAFTATSRKVHHPALRRRQRYIYRMVFYARIVKQFFVDYPLHNRIPEYLVPIADGVMSLTILYCEFLAAI